ncbi:MAG: hypothetical protein MNPFHGCM_00196 [Gemmatimonadaceae bacterium]|nr:hypothetical protein [Gemmatimonadaceae bacterium]
MRPIASPGCEKHSFASQWVAVQTSTGVVVLASDNAYLCGNFERRVPIAQTLDSASNLRTQDAMQGKAGTQDRIDPGNDRAVFVRFPAAGTGAVRVR